MNHRQIQEEEIPWGIEQEKDESDVLPLSGETHAGSAVVRVNATHRQCHLSTLLPSSELVGDVRRPIDFRVYLEAAGYLAIQHFNQRSARVLPHLQERLQDCDVYLGVKMYDTRFSPIYASRHLQDNILLAEQKSFALLGAARSAVSKTLSILAGVYELPQMSATSTSVSLDNTDISPFFARTVPTNSNDAKAVVLYLKELGVSHFGIIYIRDEFGTHFHSHLMEEAAIQGIQIISTSYGDEDSDREIVTAIRQLQSSGLHYFMGIFNPRTWKRVVKEAKRVGIIGSPDYVWLLSDASLELTQPGFQLSEPDLAQAIDGVGVVLLNVESNLEFDETLSEFETSVRLQKDFVNAHEEPAVFENYSFPFPGPTLYQYLNYDAVMALGLAACEAPQDFFTGPDFFQTLLKTEFVGVSGLVRFDNVTGTRNEQGVKYRIANVRLQNDTAAPYTFHTVTAVQVHFANTTHPIETIAGYKYAGGSTVAPDALPPLSVDLNLISKGIRAAGLSLGVLTMMCAIGWCLWTVYYRNIDCVRIAQPVFLCQLCVGAFIMASAIIPMSLQEPTQGLNVACMSVPWLLSSGFVTAFSALFSKTWRLNKLFRSGQGCRRVQVQAKDVMYPFLILSILNATILTVWTIVSPLQWTRVGKANFDMYGRYVESYGTCYSGDNRAAQYTCAVLLLIVNFVALLFALVQSYKARNLPTDFNESFYICVTIFSLLESLILGGPILLLVYTSPSADFMVKSVLLTIICLTILLPMFVPKYLQRNIRAMRKTQGRGRHKIIVHTPEAQRRFSTYGGDVSSVEPSSSFGVRSSLPDSEQVVGQSVVRRSSDYYVQRESVQSGQCWRPAFARQSTSGSSPDDRRRSSSADSRRFSSGVRRRSVFFGGRYSTAEDQSNRSLLSSSTTGRSSGKSKSGSSSDLSATKMNVASYDVVMPLTNTAAKFQLDEIRESRELSLGEDSASESLSPTKVSTWVRPLSPNPEDTQSRMPPPTAQSGEPPVTTGDQGDAVEHKLPPVVESSLPTKSTASVPSDAEEPTIPPTDRLPVDSPDAMESNLVPASESPSSTTTATRATPESPSPTTTAASARVRPISPNMEEKSKMAPTNSLPGGPCVTIQADIIESISLKGKQL